MLEKLHFSLHSYAREPAFFIDGKVYTYQDLDYLITAVQQTIFTNLHTTERIGIIANDDIETYAGLLACLLSGIAFVPIEPGHPVERNSSIIGQSELKYIFCSSVDLLSPDFLKEHQSRIMVCKDLEPSNRGHIFNRVSQEKLAYILFTSGTTGVPKGVPISRKNLDCFLRSAVEHDNSIGKGDRFLQLFDLTFDLSIYSYLIPLLAGSCVYTIPKSVVKYTFAIRLLQEQQLTHALSVPSLIQFLRPYFKEINLPSVKEWLFCGEALQDKLVSEWQKCIPNARIINVYGPTEATIFCTAYPCEGRAQLKAHNGIISIGKPFKEVDFIIIDENCIKVPDGSIGELCIAGSQTTTGYIRNDEKNRTTLLSLDSGNDQKVYYRTGDLVFQDQEGDYFFAGRIDSQVKIQGYRVELGEIENHAVAFHGVDEAVVLPLNTKEGVIGLFLFVKPGMPDNKNLMSFLKTRIPEYMLPKAIYSLNSFPLNVNGKIDRNALKEMID